jgi:IPT/TIG domain
MLLGAANAQAATVTVGSPLTSTFNSEPYSAALTLVNSGLPESGANVVSPVTGTIVRWRITQATGGPFRLRVLTPDGGTTYTGAGTSAPETPLSAGTQTFATDLSISAGQTIALDNTNASDHIGIAGPAGANTFWNPPLADGSTQAGTGTEVGEIGFNADVQPLPSIASLSPASGPVAGGTTVTITGQNFDGTTAVNFGSTPAASFAVVSDTTISAVAPSGSAGPVDLTVHNPGQSPATAADNFTYVLPRPTVTSVSPRRGPKTGGTTVTITGHDFTGATTVSFGGMPAKSLKVTSDSSITAIAPAHAPGTFDVTVSTASGQSATSPVDSFTFVQVCVVPKLKGKKLKAAKKALKNAHCSLGKLKGPRTGKVKHQSRRPKKILSAGAKVNIKLS